MTLDRKKLAWIALVILLLVLAALLWYFRERPSEMVRKKSLREKISYIDEHTDYKKIHGDFYLSNDTCSACHGNQANPKEELVRGGKINQACFSCHDGTVNTYNVVMGYVNGMTGPRTNGGSFGLERGDENSVSRHDLNIIINAAAPGGNIAGNEDALGSWGMLFECTSCHEPHNIYKNYRLLNPNVNNIAFKGRVNREKLKGNKDRTVFRASRGVWVADSFLEYEIMVNGKKARPSTFKVDLAGGRVIFKRPLARGDVVTASYYPGVQVTGRVTNYLENTERAVYYTGVNQFCAACHPDYDTENIENPTGILNGIYRLAYRHPVGVEYDRAVEGLTFGGVSNRQITCLTCHAAHGIDEDWWAGWAKQSGWQGKVSGEDNGDSCILRLPNVSTCEACHQKGKANLSY